MIGKDIEQMRQDGIIADGLSSSWNDLTPHLAALECIGRHGACVLVKIDGAREHGAVFTTVISGGALGEHFFRKDGPNIRDLLEEGIHFYVEHLKS